MARYIDEDKLLKKLSRMIGHCKKDNKITGLTALFQVGDAIMDCPTADVEEARHGKWIVPDGKLSRLKEKYVICSECDVMFPIIEEFRYYYCPNCGAKMDKE